MAPLPIDYTEDAIRHRQQQAAQRLEACGEGVLVRGPAFFPNLPASVCQKAASALRWRFRTEGKALFERAGARGAYVFFVTIVNPVWIRPQGKLNADTMVSVSRWLQQRAANNAEVELGAGFTDLVWAVSSDVAKCRFWQPHIHAVIAIRGRSQERVRSRLHEILYVKRNASLLVNQPLKVIAVYHIEGALDYCSRTLLVDGPGRRIAGRLRETGALATKELPLQPRQYVDLTRSLLTVKPESRLCLLRLRRGSNPLLRGIR